MRTRNQFLRTLIVIPIFACAYLFPIDLNATPTDTTTEKKPADTAAAAKKPHLSPLATQGPKPAPITPPKPEEIKSAINRGIKFLLADQRPDGSWGSPEHSKGLNIYAPPPGAHDAFRTAVTSLAIMALIEAKPKLP